MTAALGSCGDSSPKARVVVPKATTQFAETPAPELGDVANRREAALFGASVLQPMLFGETKVSGVLRVAKLSNLESANALYFMLTGNGAVSFRDNFGVDPTTFDGSKALPIYLVTLELPTGGRFIPPRHREGIDVAVLAQQSGTTAYAFFSPSAEWLGDGFVDSTKDMKPVFAAAGLRDSSTVPVQASAKAITLDPVALQNL